jgi:hypothetical protein
MLNSLSVLPVQPVVRNISPHAYLKLLCFVSNLLNTRSIAPCAYVCDSIFSICHPSFRSITDRFPPERCVCKTLLRYCKLYKLAPYCYCSCSLGRSGDCTPLFSFFSSSAFSSFCSYYISFSSYCSQWREGNRPMPYRIWQGRMLGKNTCDVWMGSKG